MKNIKINNKKYDNQKIKEDNQIKIVNNYKMMQIKRSEIQKKRFVK